MTAALDIAAITARATQAYAAAGLALDGLPEAVAPVQRLLQAHGLITDEIEKLSRNEAAKYLAQQSRNLIRLDDAANDDLAGFLFANAVGGWILVRRGDPLVRRRFTVAHELGHYLLHFLPELEAAMTRGDNLLQFEEEVLPAQSSEAAECDIREGRSTLMTDMETETRSNINQEELERQADSFAAIVLMPKDSCCRLVSKYASRGMAERRVLARRLASECLVSEGAMWRRLTELQLGQETVHER